MFSASFYKNRGATLFVFKMFSASFFSDIPAVAKNVRSVLFNRCLAES